MTNRRARYTPDTTESARLVDLSVRVATGTDLSTVAVHIERLGADVVRTLGRSRIVDVRADPVLTNQIARIPGVVSVREPSAITLPPMDESVPQ